MTKSDDVVLQALVEIERHERNMMHTPAGSKYIWQLAKEALAEYKRRVADAVIEDGKRATLEFARTGDSDAGRRMISGMHEESRQVYEATLRRGGIEP